MIESVLQRQLAPVVERHARIRKTRRRVLVFSVVALTSLVLFLIALQWGVGSASWLLLPLAGGMIASVLGRVLSRRPEIDVHEIAREIEENNPQLQALLVTAVEQEESSGRGRLNFLQERVVQEAAREAIAGRWRETVAEDRQRRWVLLQGLAATAMAAAFVALWFPIMNGGRSGGAGEQTPVPKVAGDAGEGWDIEVMPGDTEVERGSKVLVAARFDGRVPATARLEVELGEDNRSIPMSRNLGDPVFVAAIPEASADGSYRISFDGEASRDFHLATFVMPEVERIDAEIVPPAASGLSPKSVKDTRRITVLEGSTVRLAVRTNKPVVSGSMADAGQELEVPLAAGEEAKVLRAELVPLKNADLRVRVVDADGRENRRPPLFRISVKRNLPPRIELAFPGNDAEVTPLQELAVEATVWDDVKVTTAGMTSQFGTDGREVVFETGEFKPGKKELLSSLLEFEKLRAQPNDLLTYFFWAEDTGPDGAPRRVNGDLRFVEVRHFEEIFREAPGGGESEQQQQQQGEENQSQQLLERQKEVLNATWKLMRLVEDRPARLLDDAPVILAGQSGVIEMAREAAGMVQDGELAMHLSDAIAAMESAAGELEAIAEEGDAPRLHTALGHEQAAYAALLRLRAREFQIQRSSRQSSRSSRSSQRQQRQMMNMELKEEEKRYETQRFADQQQQEQQRDANREDLQMLNRLKELARRQGGINEKIKELQAMLEEAESEEEKEEIRRELERLEEEQREMLEDLDELNERMESEENRSRTTEEREQLEETREEAQRAAEALRNEQLEQAANAGTRAERQFDQMADEMRERTSSQFAGEMRGVRREAREMAEEEEGIAERMEEQVRGQRENREEDPFAPRPGADELAGELAAQQERLEELMEDLRELSEQAEEGEPILSRKLYEAIRETETEGVRDSLERAERYSRFNRLREAAEFERTARQGIEDLKEGIEQAAESILGDEAAGLRMARSELENLMREVEESERERAGRGGTGEQPGEEGAEEPGEGEPEPQGGDQPQVRPDDEGERPGGEGMRGREDENPEGEARGGGQGEPPGEGGRQDQDEPQEENSPPGEGRPRDGQSQEDRQPGEGQQPSEGQQPGEGERPGEGEGRSPGERRQAAREGQPAGGERQASGGGTAEGTRRGGSNFFDGWSGSEQGGPSALESPIYGGRYREWSDRLRGVEEMLDDEGLQQEVARLRGRAREMRRDYNRHSEAPEWELLDEQIMKPLVELRQRIDDELSRIEEPESRLPLDRDPVPGPYEELVRKYYERLGSGE